eukprot:5642689-Pleurochrysis_carterae.AAC.6
MPRADATSDRGEQSKQRKQQPFLVTVSLRAAAGVCRCRRCYSRAAHAHAHAQGLPRAEAPPRWCVVRRAARSQL